MKHINQLTGKEAYSCKSHFPSLLVENWLKKGGFVEKCWFFPLLGALG